MCRYIYILAIMLCPFLVRAQIVGTLYGNNNLKGFVDSSHNWVVPPIYQSAEWKSSAKLGMFKQNNMWGCLNEEGNVIIPCQYTYIYINEYGVIAHDAQGKKYAFDRNGNNALSGEFQHISLSEKSIFANSRGKSALYDWNGNVKVTFQKVYNFAHESLNQKFIWVYCDSTKGIADYNGHEIIPSVYKGVGWLKVGGDEIVVTDMKGKKGLLSTNGNELIPCRYDYINQAADNIWIINNGGGWDKGKYQGGMWGYWANGEEIIPCIYDEATEFKNDVATVKKDGEVRLIKNPLKDASQILIAEGAAPSKKKKGTVVSRYPAPDSDVDKDIPSAKRPAENTFAFIIANENYPDAPVPYSLNDGRVFKEYCQKALGLPEKNINMYEDATFGNIITAVEKMKSVADAYEGDASIIFYYAGHGFPDDKQATAYLLPIDGNASDITTTGYSLAKLYKEISSLKLKSSVVFLDACFSGAKREDQMLAQSRGVAIKVRDEAPQGNMVVFSAAQGDETAHQMEEKHHGLFTYFLLKELQATGGDVDMGTLTDYVTKQVKRQSVVINNKKQTPTVIPSSELVNTWRNLKLK